MGTIFFHLHTWGTGAACLQRFLFSQKDWLAERNLVYGHAAYEALANSHNHQGLCNRLIYQRRGDGTRPDNIQKVLDSWKEILDSGKNILVSYRPREFAKSFLTLHSIFSTLPGFANFKKKYFLSLGRPDFALEDFLRASPYPRDASIVETMRNFDRYEFFLRKY